MIAMVILAFPIAQQSGAATDQHGCDRIASPRGHSHGNGTIKRPFHSPQRLIDSLRKGQTGCFRGGHYRFSLARVGTPGVTLTNYRNEKVSLRGSIKVVPSGAGSVIAGMRLNGKGGESDIGPKIYADDVVLRNNRITNLHSDICILLARFYNRPAPRDVIIRNNRIHDCGELPATNYDHGIYLSAGVGTVITDNLIYDNADRGIQLYPSPRKTQITGNVLDRNGDGIVITGSGATAPAENLISGNVISNSRLSWNVRSGPNGLTGKQNAVTRNCVYANSRENFFNSDGGIETPSRNFKASGNLIAKPRYRKAKRSDFHLRRTSRCLDVYSGTMALP